jgi:hypothetical protein
VHSTSASSEARAFTDIPAPPTINFSDSSPHVVGFDDIYADPVYLPESSKHLPVLNQASAVVRSDKSRS